MDEMLIHEACGRGGQRALVIGDMPFISYQASSEDACVMQDVSSSWGQAIKLEGGARWPIGWLQ